MELIVLSITFVALAVTFGGTRCLRKVRKLTKGENTYKTEGEVIGYSKKQIKSHHSEGYEFTYYVYYHTYRYYYNGEYCTFKGEGGKKCIQIGETATLLINTQTGEVQEVKDKVLLTILGVVLLIIGIGTGIIALAVFVSLY